MIKQSYFVASTYRRRFRVYHGVSSSDKVLFRIGRFFVKNLQHTGLQLRHNGHVTGAYTEFSFTVIFCYLHGDNDLKKKRQQKRNNFAR